MKKLLEMERAPKDSAENKTNNFKIAYQKIVYIKISLLDHGFLLGEMIFLDLSYNTSYLK